MAKMVCGQRKFSTLECLKHFHPADMYRSPGGWCRHSLTKGSRLKLHSWNTFRDRLGKSRKLAGHHQERKCI